MCAEGALRPLRPGVLSRGSLIVGHSVVRLDPAGLQTLAVVTLVFSGRAVFYVAREGRRPDNV